MGVTLDGHAENTTQNQEFAQVVGVVVGDEEGFAEDGLAGAVRERREEVRVFVLHEFDHGVEIGVEGFDRVVPGFGVGRRGRFWPVAGRPIRRNVFRVAREFEDVPLRKAHVFEHFPGGVRGAFRADALEFRGPVFDGIVKSDVRLAALEKFNEMIGKRFLFLHVGFF